ncbi:MAG: toll/interleukin-1 receptor domain-containing protein [Hyphomonadaceae bacterium]|nr:toll/interleukin-1 receptor domain-containing protein [Hyphomonadaceae bacterium]
MADVFISYAREDVSKAKLLAEALSANGLSVWWDHDIMGGEEFRTQIDETISAAKLVIVIWSENSVKSPFVKDEASRANARDKLLPVAIGEVEPPVGFGELQTIRFKRWAETTTEWETLVRTVDARLASQGMKRSSRISPTQRDIAFVNRNIDVFLLTMFAQSVACFLVFQPLHFLTAIPGDTKLGFVIVTSILLAGIHTSGLIARRAGIVLRLITFAAGAVSGYFSYLFADNISNQLSALGDNAALMAGGGVSLFNAFVFFIYVLVMGAIGLMSDR